jgi:hypothetical protein
MEIVTHPNNAEWYRDKLQEQGYDQLRVRENEFVPEIQTDLQFIDGTTKEITTPFVFESPFVEYGPKDTRHLKYMKLAKEIERKPAYLFDPAEAYRSLSEPIMRKPTFSYPCNSRNAL